MKYRCKICKKDIYFQRRFHLQKEHGIIIPYLKGKDRQKVEGKFIEIVEGTHPTGEYLAFWITSLFVALIVGTFSPLKFAVPFSMMAWLLCMMQFYIISIYAKMSGQKK